MVIICNKSLRCLASWPRRRRRCGEPRIKRTVACSPPTEEDHDPSVPAHTGHRHRGLRVQLFGLSGHSYIDRQMLKGPSCKEKSPRIFRCLHPAWQQSTFCYSDSSTRINISYLLLEVRL